MQHHSWKTSGNCHLNPREGQLNIGKTKNYKHEWSELEKSLDAKYAILLLFSPENLINIKTD